MIGVLVALFKKILSNTLIEKFDQCLLAPVRKRFVKSFPKDEGLTLKTSAFESLTVANLPYRPYG